MKTHDILRDAASRPGIEAAVAVKGLSAEALNAHPGGHPNSIAWLLWHAGRQMDMQLSALNGQPQVWETQGFRERFNLGELGDTMGYGHTAEQARSIV
ncbi:MAG: DinB family protein, partial [Rothia sp.]|nr:DinB family protein [Rothia sp. (in: high G+C Gram-positive bacteria)]